MGPDGIRIIELTSDAPGFWPLAGPLAASRDVARELGGPVYDEPGKTWLIAVAPDGTAAGICAALPGEVTVYQSDYVLPGFRGRGVYRALCAARAAAFPGPARAVVSPAAVGAYLAGGFAAERMRGRYAVMTRDAITPPPAAPAPAPPAAAALPAAPAPEGMPGAQGIEADAAAVFARLAALPDDERTDVINRVRLALSEHSPHRGEPVDCVLWVPQDEVTANDYNPNVVAPAEMRLLTLSIIEDGYTQPVVAWAAEGGGYEVVDGFHRNRVAREAAAVRRRVRGRLPVAVIRPDRAAKSDRMAATIRHNRARGVHTVDGMSAIVLDLARRNHDDAWIARELGMEPDEVLRLKQVQAMAELFADREFSEAWEAC